VLGDEGGHLKEEGALADPGSPPTEHQGARDDAPEDAADLGAPRAAQAHPPPASSAVLTSVSRRGARGAPSLRLEPAPSQPPARPPRCAWAAPPPPSATLQGRKRE